MKEMKPTKKRSKREVKNMIEEQEDTFDWDDIELDDEIE